MRRVLILTASIAAMTFAAPLAPQAPVVEVRTPKNWQAIQQDFERAFKDWADSDQNLQSQVPFKPVDEARRLIDRAANLRDTLDDVMSAYYKALGDEYQRQIVVLEGTTLPPDFPPGAKAAMTAATQRQLAELSEQYRQVQAENESNAGDPRKLPMKKAVTSEQEHLSGIQKTLLEQQQALETLSAPDPALEHDRKTLLDSYTRLVTTLRTGQDRARNSALTWDHYYETLRQAVHDRSVSPHQSILGTWLGGAGLPNDAPYPAEQIELRIKEEAGYIEGVFFARYKIGSPGPLARDDVFLRFQGSAVGAIREGGRYQFSFEDPGGLKGTIVIVPPVRNQGLDVVWQSEGPNGARFEHVLRRSQ
jgi:hypothetical protein